VPFNLKVNKDEVAKVFQNMTMWRNTYEEEMDGIVIKFNSHSIKEQLGSKSTCPVWAIAWKFNSMVGETTVEDIHWSISKYGTLTPVAKVKPVDIGGVTISNINLHNYEFATKLLDVHIGDVVKVRRAGDVIPEIVGVNTLARKTDIVKPIDLPDKCPSCGHSLGITSVNVVCLNKDCEEQVKLRLLHFASKEAINIVGLSSETVKYLVENEGFAILRDFYIFDYSSLENVPGYGKRKIEKFKQAIEDSKKTTLGRFIYAMAIPEIGRRTANEIAKYINDNNIKTPFYKIPETTLISTWKIPNVGESVSISFRDWCRKADEDEMEKLMAIFTFTDKVKPVVKKDEATVVSSNNNATQVIPDNAIKDQRILFTGTLSTMGITRDMASRSVERLGGTIASSLTYTDILIVGDKPGSKLQKARARGITIMLEDEFSRVCKVHGI